MWSTVNAVGEQANPEVRKARRAAGDQAHMNYDSPGMPATPMQGKRKNGNLARSLGTDASPRIARRRGSR